MAHFLSLLTVLVITIPAFAAPEYKVGQKRLMYPHLRNCFEAKGGIITGTPVDPDLCQAGYKWGLDRTGTHNCYRKDVSGTAYGPYVGDRFCPEKN